jgi:hypothetical protein
MNVAATFFFHIKKGYYKESPELFIYEKDIGEKYSSNEASEKK